MTEIRRSQHAGDADVVAEVRQTYEDRPDEQHEAAAQDLGAIRVLREPARHETVPSTPTRGSHHIVSGFALMRPDHPPC